MVHKFAGRALICMVLVGVVELFLGREMYLAALLGEEMGSRIVAAGAAMTFFVGCVATLSSFTPYAINRGSSPQSAPLILQIGFLLFGAAFGLVLATVAILLVEERGLLPLTPGSVSFVVSLTPKFGVEVLAWLVVMAFVFFGLLSITRWWGERRREPSPSD